MAAVVYLLSTHFNPPARLRPSPLSSSICPLPLRWSPLAPRIACSIVIYSRTPPGSRPDLVCRLREGDRSDVGDEEVREVM